MVVSTGGWVAGGGEGYDLIDGSWSQHVFTKHSSVGTHFNTGERRSCHHPISGAVTRGVHSSAHIQHRAHPGEHLKHAPPMGDITINHKSNSLH